MRYRPRVVELDPALDAPAILRALRGERGLVAFDSASGEPREWSLILFDPLAPTPASRGAETSAIRGIDDARAAHARLELAPGDAVPGPFHGGFAGAFAYDLGVHGERHETLPDDAWRSPRAVGGLYVDFVVRDERAGRTWLVVGDGAFEDRPRVDARIERLRARLAVPTARASTPLPRTDGPLVRHTSAEEHRARVERLREHVAAGDFYQANLSHRFTRRVTGDPLDLYLALRVRNPAPYMGYLEWDASSVAEGRLARGALLSASPELLLEFDGHSARTRPIKGTSARHADPARDRASAEALVASEKDRAELAMIVDLERNDLGRCARAGGVRVERFAHLESYARVHHLTADVVAEPAPGVDAFDLIAALFPGGSITGAPKLAAMDAIARLEGEGRGFFTGSMGFVDARGHAAWNILIRTLVWRPLDDAAGNVSGRGGAGELSFHVGGGITWLSDAAAEERETLAKAAALIEMLDALDADTDRARDGRGER